MKTTTSYLITRLCLLGESDAAHIVKDVEQYEGWGNRETWAVNLHINNNRWMYDFKKDLLKLYGSEFFKHELADELEEVVTKWFDYCWSGTIDLYFPSRETATVKRDIRSMVQDVGSFNRVDYLEIAEDWIGESK